VECVHGHGQLKIDYRRDGKIVWVCPVWGCDSKVITDDEEASQPPTYDNSTMYEGVKHEMD